MPCNEGYLFCHTQYIIVPYQTIFQPVLHYSSVPSKKRLLHTLVRNLGSIYQCIIARTLSLVVNLEHDSARFIFSLCSVSDFNHVTSSVYAVLHCLNMLHPQFM